MLYNKNDQITENKNNDDCRRPSYIHQEIFFNNLNKIIINNEQLINK